MILEVLMIATLRPHGWLLVEEPDFVTPFHACASQTVCKVVTAGIRTMETMTGGPSPSMDDACSMMSVRRAWSTSRRSGES